MPQNFTFNISSKHLISAIKKLNSCKIEICKQISKHVRPNPCKLALTDRESDNATAPRSPDHIRMAASFKSKPYPKYRKNGYNAPTTMQRDICTKM